MKIRFLLFCGVLLGPMVALSRGGPASILVSTVTRPASAGKDSQAIADYFESQVVKMLLDKYPCAQPLTASDVHELLDWERQRELLVSDADADLTAIADAVGAKYVISLTVTELGSGQLSLKASMIDTTTPTALQAQANSTRHERRRCCARCRRSDGKTVRRRPE